MIMTLLDPLSEFIADLSYDNLSADTIEKTELHIFDTLGAMLAASTLEEARACCDLVKKIVSINGSNDIPVPGYGFSTSLSYAVFLSCISTRMTETDDIHLPSCTTPGSIIVPAALLSAYYAGESARHMFEGILAGYDVMTRLGAAVKGSDIVYRGIWPTYLCGALCAATIGAKIFGLNKDQIKHALAISLTMSTGLSGKIMTGLTSRWLTLGCAVQNGLFASLAAEKGFAGDHTILDGPFTSVYGLDMDTSVLLDGLGDKFRIEEMSMKPFCTARQALSPTEAFRWLLDAQQIDPESIEEIQVIVPQQYSQMIDRPEIPEARLPSIVSVQYQMALTAYYEEGLYDLHRKKLKDNDKIQNFIKKVRVTTSPEYTFLYPRKWAGKITLKTTGKTYEHEVLDPVGSPDKPMEWGDVELKTKRMTIGTLESAQVEDLGAAVKTLKNCQVVSDFIGRIPMSHLDH